MSVEIPTGIYYHYRGGNLYFLKEIGQDHDTGEPVAIYNALYPLENSKFKSGRAFTRPLKEFNGLVYPEGSNLLHRLTLVQALPVEKMPLLLPGAKVAFSEKGLEGEVVRVFEDKSVIFVQLLGKVFATKMSYFLQKAFLLETS